jgi:hypothetical protein
MSYLMTIVGLVGYVVATYKVMDKVFHTESLYVYTVGLAWMLSTPFLLGYILWKLGGGV